MLSRLPELVQKLGNRFVIITDDNLINLGNNVLKSLKRSGLKADLLSIKPGEKSKTREL